MATRHKQPSSSAGKSSKKTPGKSPARRVEGKGSISRTSSTDTEETSYARGRSVESTPSTGKTGDRPGARNMERDEIGEDYESGRRDALP
jgi:hypothetical protein